MKSAEFIFAVVSVLMLSETSSSPSIFSVMYVPRSTELAQLGLSEMMWGDNIVDWERLHTTVSMQTRDGLKAGCRYRVSVVPVDGDGLPIAVVRGQARELGCEVQLCGLNDGNEECVMSNGNYSDVMGKCHLSIPTSLAEAGNGYRWVGVESTAISVEAGCQLSSESLPGLTALLEPYTAVYECASDEFWSQDVQECLPCETDDTTYLCSPGFYVKGCDSLAHVLDESTICSPCPNTPADFASGHYRWKEGEECVLECDQGLFYMNGTVCEPCTELLRTCTDEESNHCCAKQAGQMWRACTATENEACVDCPAISKSIYSENEEFIPWSHECEHYLQQDGDLSALCECHTTCKDGFYRSLESDLLDTLPCVPCSGMVDLAVQARLTRTSNEFFRYQQCTKASNTQLVQCVGKPIGCDGVPYSTVVVDICGVCGGSNDTCTGCDGVVASGAVIDACGICDGDNTTCAGCDGVPNSGLVVDVCGQCGGDNTSCWGCDNISNSGLVFDVCGVCGGDGSSCWGCDNISNSGLKFDVCNVCGGDNATCTGCDGVLFSGKVPDSCGVCDGGDQAQDGCGVCYGDNTSCVGCDGIFKSGIFNDSCGVCGGNNSTCAGCDGIPHSGKVIDFCDVCGGDNTSCIGCDGVLNSGKKNDTCNVCGGDNTTCECDVGYTGPQYGKLTDSCVRCGPGTYKEVNGSAPCTECGFNTYNPEYGSTSSSACLPCMEHSETEEIYGHESIHACMCVSGYYHDTVTSCTACTPGTFNAEKNQTQCSNCFAGYYSNGPNSSTCEICPNATYSHEGSALCTPCNLNASSSEGSNSIGDCVCDVGFYSDITQQSQFGAVSTEVDTSVANREGNSVYVTDVKISHNGEWAVYVHGYDVKYVNLNSPQTSITQLAENAGADGVCLNSDSSKMFYSGFDIKITIYHMTPDPSSPTSSKSSDNIYSGTFGRAREGCVVSSDGHVIFTNWVTIDEVSVSSGLITKTYNIGGDYNNRILSLTVTGEDDNIILYIHMSQVWKIDRSGSSWVQLPTSGSGWNINQFNNPSGLTMSNNRQTVYFLTTTGIAAIDYATGSVSTVAGHDVTTTTGDDGCTDGTRNEATFDTSTFSLAGMSVSPDGMYLLVPGDQCNNIRRVDLVPQVTSHCKACAAGTYKNIIGPQACESCESCPAGQYRLGCTTSSPGACVDCPSCGEGQYRVNCAGQSTGECVACLAHADITWYLEDADEGLTGGSSPDQSCDQICAEQNMVCDQSTLNKAIRFETPTDISMYDILSETGLYYSGEFNGVGTSQDECQITPYMKSDGGSYSKWHVESRAGADVECYQTSQCSAVASEIPLTSTYKYQRLCPCTCGADYYINGCGGTNSGVCTPCETCPSGQYRQNCSLYDPGVCVDCATLHLYPGPLGSTTTIAGSCASQGQTDADGLSATFDNPVDIKFVHDNRALVVDRERGLIRSIDLANNYAVTTLAGSSCCGLVDGIGTAAQFYYPRGLCVNADGSLVYVMDTGNSKIRIITMSTAAVSTLSMSVSKGWRGCVVAGDYLIANDYSDIYEIEIDTGDIIKTYTDAVDVETVSLLNDGSTIFYGTYAGQIYRLPRSGDTSILIAGGAQHADNLDGVGTGANFAAPHGTIVSKDDKTLYVSASYAIRAIDLETQTVTTIAGPTSPIPGCTDGSASTARFHAPRGMDISPDGTYLLVTSSPKHIIRKISLGPISTCHCEECPSGQYRTSCIGNCQACNFTCPVGQYLEGCGGVAAGTCAACPAGKYKTEASAQPCQSCSDCPAGEERVNCTSGSAGMCVACSAGTYKVNVSAQLCQPCPSCPQNSTRIGCSGANVGSCAEIIINPDAEGITTTPFGSVNSDGPCSSEGAVGNAATFKEPKAVIDLSNNLAAVADPSCRKVYLLNLNDNSVTTLAGTGSSGTSDHIVGSSATLNYPQALCKSPSEDTLYIVDNSGQRIRVVDMTSETYAVTTLAVYSGKYLTGCAVTSDGLNMIISYNGGMFEVAISSPSTTLVTYSGPASNNGVTLSADDTTIFYAQSNALYKLTRGNANSNTVWSSGYASSLGSILISADGTFAYVHNLFGIWKVQVGNGDKFQLVGNDVWTLPLHSDTAGSETFYGLGLTMGYVQNGMYFLVADVHNKVIRKVSTGLDGVRTIT